MSSLTPREIVAELDGVLVIGHFARMQAAIDVDERLHVAGECMCLFVGDAARQSETARCLFVVVELRKILGVRDDKEPP